MLVAVTRAVSPSIGRCELTHLAREPIDVERAAQQHAAYEELLRSLGATVERVPEARELPDAVFVEDTAIVLDEIAIVTRPGAPSRRHECADVWPVLERHRPVRFMSAPAILDGGDVLRLDRTLYVGRSSRTNEAGFEQLRDLAAPLGYNVVPVEFTHCLHLKSAATAIAADRVLVNPAWVSADVFDGCEALCIDPAEPFAANALRIADAVVYPTHFPRTAERLRSLGLRVATTECRELAKAEGALTCCSLVFESEV